MRHLYLTLGLVLLGARASQAACGAASCPLDTRSAYYSEKGSLRLAYEFEYIDQDQPRVGKHKAAIGEIRGHHDEERTVNRTHRLAIAYGLTDRLSWDIFLPVVSRSHRHIHHHHGAALHDGWDFTGLGDLSTQVRYAVYKPAEASRPTLYGIAGAEFPTGKSHVTNANGDPAELGVTPGSASWDFLVGGASLQHFSVPTLRKAYAQLPLFVSVTYKMNNAGHDNYRLGNALSANFGVTYPVLESVGVVAQLNGLVRGKDDRGQTREEVEKTGGEFLYVSPGLQWRPTQRLEWTILLQVPIYQRVNAIQLTAPFNLLTSVAFRFQPGAF